MGLRHVGAFKLRSPLFGFDRPLRTLLVVATVVATDRFCRAAGSRNRGARIQSSCAVVVAPTLTAHSPAGAHGRVRKAEAAGGSFSDPSTSTAATTTTSRSVARSADWRSAGVRSLTPAASPRPATHRGLRSGSRRSLARAQHLSGAPVQGPWCARPSLGERAPHASQTRSRLATVPPRSVMLAVVLARANTWSTISAASRPTPPSSDDAIARWNGRPTK